MPSNVWMYSLQELGSLPTEEYARLVINFSAATASATVQVRFFYAFPIQSYHRYEQDVIESVLEKRSKNKMGPTAGKKLVVFVDGECCEFLQDGVSIVMYYADLNMPRRDTFGSQPPLELLRQWIDYGGWYDRGKQTWRFILDMQVRVILLVANVNP